VVVGAAVDVVVGDGPTLFWLAWDARPGPLQAAVAKASALKATRLLNRRRPISTRTSSSGLL
jgi:hypothetical protein